MQIFIKKTIIFIIPFMIITALEIYIDPYNYFSYETNSGMIKLKNEISQKKNGYLFKIIEYNRDPVPVIILGESRTAALSPALFEDLSKERTANLAAGGGSLQDVIEIFWYVSQKHKLHKVIIGISLTTYNGILLRDRVSQSIEIINSTPRYLFSSFCFESTMLICKSIIFGQEIAIGKPKMSKDDFWEFQLSNTARYFGNYSYPQNYYIQLAKVAQYCNDNNIKLIFCINPTHTDLQKKIVEFGLTREYTKFKKDITFFGDVFDFDIHNIMTNDKKNFTDPYHCTESFSKIIVNEMALNTPAFSNYYKSVDNMQDDTLRSNNTQFSHQLNILRK